MEHFPGPVHSDKADEAEARRRTLRNRFRVVSRRIDDRGGDGADGAGMGFSPFEIGLAVAVALFVVWAALRAFGGV